MAADFLANLRDGVRSKVGQAAKLEVAPHLFLWIQFGSVRREPCHVPLRMLAEILPNLVVAMRLAVIPEQEKRPRIMTAQVSEKMLDLVAADILFGIEGQEETHTMPARRDDQRTDAGDLFVTTLADGQRRSDSSRSPSPPQDGGHQESRFVQANQARV